MAKSATPILGAHQSIAGGYYRAAELAQECGCQCVQLFTKNNNQWRAKEITDDDAKAFREALVALQYFAPDRARLVSDQSCRARPGALDALAGVVRDGTGPCRKAWHSVPGYASRRLHHQLARRRGLNESSKRSTRPTGRRGKLKVITLLEVTAGQGSNLGHRFEHLATVLDGVRDPERLAVCIDTCHLFAAGYPLFPEKEYRATMKEFDRVLGLKLIKAIHLNDSKRELGSRVDRHEHIGRGKIGLEGFRLLLNDSRLRKVPMYLETPKEENGEPRGIELDRMNLQTLRSLVNS